MKLASINRAILLALAAFALSSCADFNMATRRFPRHLPPFSGNEGFWRGDHVAGSPKIVVRVAEQRAYYYKGRKLVGLSTVSTGKRGLDTPPGHYRVVERDRDHVSSEFGDHVDDRGNVVKLNIDVRKDPLPAGAHFDGTRMPYFLRFNGGYGMHAGYVPKFRASHGCIRLPTSMAKHFFENAREDTPVVVRNDPRGAAPTG